jgi:hypothetical protein
MKYLLKYSALVFFLLSTACETEHTVAVQPAATVVQRTSPPFENGVWIDNEYRWDGTNYIIVPAHWEKSRGTWVPGHWKSTPKGYTWIRGHWK